MEHKAKVKQIIQPNRLDRFLAGELTYSRSVISKFIKSGFVSVNKEIIHEPDLPLHMGDRIEVKLQDKKTSANTKKLLPILYEDRDLVAVKKPAGMLTHPTSSLGFTLKHEVAKTLGVFDSPSVALWATKKWKTQVQVPRLGIVHRLDQEASGVLLVAKNQMAYNALTHAFRQRSVKKTYLALVWGSLAEAKGAVSLPIYKQYGKRGVRVQAHESQGKDALTHFERIKILAHATNTASLVRLKPTTGRTHQLRIHMDSMGHPICGDILRVPKTNKDPFGRLMLHACRLELKHPRTGKNLDLHWMPENDFKAQITAHLKAKIPSKAC